MSFFCRFFDIFKKQNNSIITSKEGVVYSDDILKQYLSYLALSLFCFKETLWQNLLKKLKKKLKKLKDI